MTSLRHGDSFRGNVAPEYRAWTGMLQRCTKPTHANYAQYGGRGISVCARWHTYENFLADMGRRPSAKHTLERIKNEKGYSPENCKWALPVEQIRNRRNTKFITFDGQKMAIGAALEMCGYQATEPNIERVKWRIANGWTVSDAVRMPVQAKTYRYAPTAA